MLKEIIIDTTIIIAKAGLQTIKYFLPIQPEINVVEARKILSPLNETKIKERFLELYNKNNGFPYLQGKIKNAYLKLTEFHKNIL